MKVNNIQNKVLNICTPKQFIKIGKSVCLLIRYIAYTDSCSLKSIL